MQNFLGNDPVKREERDLSTESAEERLNCFALEKDVVDGIDLRLHLAPLQPQTLFNVYPSWAQNLGHVEEDIYTIKKFLDDSDVGSLGRVWLRKKMVDKFVAPDLTAEQKRQVEGGGLRVAVRDVNTRMEKWLVLKSRNGVSYTLSSNWMEEFVHRRRLSAGDKIGMFSDGHSHCFYFSLLCRRFL
ncbi:hypothetical protein Sjap_003617 [Stephania japonica]|uniref:TF-B3 domain-containing protein n=1 Tax=Stephania japonica TaxID=461633 RepID=A0AAP0KR66_9MAGN